MLESWPQRSFTFAELVARYRVAAGDAAATHDDLTSAFGALIHDGIVERVGREPGRTRRATRYRFVGVIGPQAPNDELTRAIVTAIATHYATHQTPMATAEVREALRQRQAWPDRFARLHNRLVTLSESRPPAIRRASGLSLGGAQSAFWLPPAAPDQCTLTPANATEALRRAIDAVAESLGRPVSKREIITWLEIQPMTSPIRQAIAPGRVSSLLRNVRGRESPATPRGPRLRVVTGPLTCHGGSPARYALRTHGDDDAKVCRLLDAVHATRPASELAAIARLARYPTGHPIHELGRRRRCVLRRALVSYVGDMDAAHFQSLASRARSGLCTEMHWVAEHSGSYAARRHRLQPVEHTLAHLDAAERLLELGDVDTDAQRPRVVGEAALASVAELRAVAVDMMERGVLARTAREHLLFRHARRFPQRDGHGWRSPDQHSLIDRVDALTEMVGRSSDLVLRARVTRAHRLVGDVLRDRAPLVDLIDRLSPSDDLAVAARDAITFYFGE